MKPHSFQFPKKICYWPGSEFCETGLWTLILAGYMSPTPTLYPYKSLQTTMHRKIGVHQEPQCLRFQNGPHEEHSLLPWAYQCLQWTGSSIPFIINGSIEPMLRLWEGSSLYGPEFALQFNKLITKIIESDWHVTRDTKWPNFASSNSFCKSDHRTSPKICHQLPCLDLPPQWAATAPQPRVLRFSPNASWPNSW